MSLLNSNRHIEFINIYFLQIFLNNEDSNYDNDFVYILILIKIK